jgi:hypothetical protein
MLKLKSFSFVPLRLLRSYSLNGMVYPTSPATADYIAFLTTPLLRVANSVWGRLIFGA